MKKLMLIAVIGLCGNAVFAQQTGKKLEVKQKLSPVMESKSASGNSLWVSVNDANKSASTTTNTSGWKAIVPTKETAAPNKLQK
ncbi:MAG: hypothetical protein ACPG5W_10160 [Flavobacteriales bacterium]